MKAILLSFCFFCITMTFSQTFDVETIKYSGENDKRINFVIMGDGYTAAQQDLFISDATDFSDYLFDQSPFSEYENYFNVYAIKVISNESGASHPGTASDEGTSQTVPISSVDNYFGTSFDSYNIHRLLYTFNLASINTVLATNFPESDQGIILINSPYYGGSGGYYAMASTDPSSAEVAVHELGHSFGNLKDEYYPGASYMSESINMTQDNNPATIKWNNWFGDNGIGAYAYGSSGVAANWYRPHQTCKMRYLGYDFCSVCKEGIIERIHTLITPIDSYSPNELSIDNPEFPLEFQLNLIDPIPNTLSRIWTINGTEFSSDVDTISINSEDLEEGENMVSVSVTDDTELLRVDNHETLHIYTVNWTVTYETLHISEVTENSITLKIYPNPASEFITVNIKSQASSNFKAELVSMDGKIIQSKKLESTISQNISLSHIPQGFYLIKIYENNQLITTKKMIKS